MKKKLLYGFIVCAFLLLGGGTASAQSASPLDEDMTALANTIVEQNMSDPDAANKSFQKFFRKIRNNKEALSYAGRFFLEKNVYSCAKFCAERAYEVDPQDISVLMLNGEVCMMRKDYGAAGQKFDEILFIDSTNVEALKLNARVYKYVNPHVALEMLQRIKRIEPDNIAADKEIGDIAYNLGESKDAVKAYDGYFKGTAPADLDIRSMENYLISLFSTKGYQKALDVLKVVGPLQEKILIFDRMKFFCSYENYELDEAETALAYLTEKRYDDSLYIYLDYAEASGYKKERGLMGEAAAFMAQALEKSPERALGWKELSDLYQNDKNFEAAVEPYKKFLELNADKNQAVDTMKLGVIYFNASMAYPERRDEFVAAGAEVFEAIARQVPNSYLGPLWLARISNTSEEPLDNVRAAYEEVLKRAGEKEDAKQDRVEALAYLAFYALKKDQDEDALKYSEEVLKLDPEHPMAQQIKAVLSK